MPKPSNAAATCAGRHGNPEVECCNKIFGTSRRAQSGPYSSLLCGHACLSLATNGRRIACNMFDCNGFPDGSRRPSRLRILGDACLMNWSAGLFNRPPSQTTFTSESIHGLLVNCVPHMLSVWVKLRLCLRSMHTPCIVLEGQTGFQMP